MITIHTLREITKIAQQKKKEEEQIKAHKWIVETLFPELLEAAKQGEGSSIVIFPRDIDITIGRNLLRNIGFSCECIYDDDSKCENFKAIVSWL